MRARARGAMARSGGCSPAPRRAMRRAAAAAAAHAALLLLACSSLLVGGATGKKHVEGKDAPHFECKGGNVWHEVRGGRVAMLCAMGTLRARGSAAQRGGSAPRFALAQDGKATGSGVAALCSAQGLPLGVYPSPTPPKITRGPLKAARRARASRDG